MSDIVLYGGDVVLRFDERWHVYRQIIDGVKRRVPGVTGITGMLDKSGPLMGWAMKEAEKFLLAEWAPGRVYDQVEINDVARRMKRAHKDSLAKAADIGTMVHDLAERDARGLELPAVHNEKVLACFEEYKAWRDRHLEEVIEAEFRCMSREHFYAGTSDLDCVIDGRRSIVDFKTSSGAYPEMGMQLAAYQYARTEEHGHEYATRYIVRFPREGGDFEVAEYPEFERDLAAFLACRQLYLAFKESGWKDFRGWENV